MELIDLKILYIEDDISISKEIASVLEKKFSQVFSVGNAKDGLDVYYKNQPDIILTDITMPQLSGLDMIEEIRKNDQKTPIVVISAFNDFKNLQRSIRLKVTRYLEKPLKVEKLFETLDDIVEEIYEKKNNEFLHETLKKEKRKYQQLMQLSSESIFITDFDGNVLEYSTTAKDALQYSDEEMNHLSIFTIDVFFPKEKLLEMFNALDNKSMEFETVHQKKDGNLFKVSVKVSKIVIESEELLYIVSRDISEYKKMNNRLQKLLDTQTNIVLLTGTQKIQYGNKALLDFFGYKSLDDFQNEVGCICKKFIQNERYYFPKDNITDALWIEEFKKLPKDKKVVAMMDKHFEIHVFSVDLNVFDQDSNLITFTDISHNMIKTLELEDKVIHDMLTGAFNREYFESNVYHIIKRFEKQGGILALSYMDIDFFKQVNDTYGHDVGDYVLKELVLLVKNNSRLDDIIVRFGGEEFVVLLQVKEMTGAQKALEHFRELIENHKFDEVGQLTCSFGVTLYKDNEDISKTIKRADEALYEAKHGGRNRVIVKE